MRKKEHFQREVDTRRSRQLSERDVLPVLWPVCSSCILRGLGREDCSAVVSQNSHSKTNEKEDSIMQDKAQNLGASGC